jgi:hypothetical protein
MLPRKSAATVLARVQTIKATTDSNGQVLKFDFGAKPATASKGPVTPDEKSTIKEAIIRWLDEQL